MKQLTIVLILCCAAVTASSQKTGNFDGLINFDIEYAGEKAEMLNSMAPSAYTYMVRGSKIRVKTEGGMAASGDIVIHGNKGESYMLKKNEKKALRLAGDNDDKDSDMKVEKLDATKEISGYNCTKHKVVMQTEQGEVTQFIWATPDLQIDIDESVQTSGAASNISMEGIDGLPLEVKSSFPMASMKMTMTAEDINWKKIEKSQFEIPDNYTVEEVDPEEMQQMGGGMR